MTTRIEDLIAEARDYATNCVDNKATLSRGAYAVGLIHRLADDLEATLAKRDAEVAAKAVEGLAESYAYVHAVERTHSYVYKWLRARAAEYRKAVQS